MPERRSPALLRAALCASVALATTSASAQERQAVAFRVGGDVGVSRLSNETFWQVNATSLVRFGPLRFDLSAPLRFSLSEFRFREEDYAQPRDAMRVLRCARLDLGDYTPRPDRYDPTCEPYKDPDHVNEGVYASARVLPLRQITLGHGTLVGGYSNSLDPNAPQAGAQIDALWREMGHLHFVLDDVTLPRFFGGTLGFRPIQYNLSSEDRNTSELQFEVGVVGDREAPLHVRGAFGVPGRDSDGNLLMSTTGLTAISADAHYMRLFDACASRPDLLCNTFLFAHVDYNRFLEVEDGDGLHAKAEIRWDLYERLRGATSDDDEVSWRPTWGVHAGAEYRNIGSRYQPTYFDGNYSVQRDQFALTSDARAALGSGALTTTKLEWLLARPLGREHGYQGYLQVFFPIPTVSGRAPSRLPLTLRVEDATGPLRAAVSAQLGPFRMDQVSASAEFLRRNFDSLGNIFSVDGAMIRVVGTVYLTQQSGNDSAASSLLGGLTLNLFYNRRFLREETGALDTVQDFMVTLGTSANLLGGSR